MIVCWKHKIQDRCYSTRDKDIQDQSNAFTYLGWKMEELEDSITINQNDYGKYIKPIPVESARRNNLDELLSDKETKQNQGLLGKILWLSSQTRPVLSYDTLEQSTFGKSPPIRDLLSLNKSAK